MAAPKKTTTKKAPTAKAPAQKAPAKNISASGKNTKTVLIVVGVVVAVFIVLPIIALTTFGLVVGNKLKENGTTVSTSNNGEGSVHIKDKNGNEINVGGSQKLPDTFPSNIPLYDGKITASGKVTVEGKTGWTVTVTTPDDLATVGSWNTSQYSNTGWKTNLDSTTDKGGLLTATNGTYRVSAFSSNQDGTTTILYTVSPESQQ